MPWICNCGLINSGINSYCAGRSYFGLDEHYQVTPTTFDLMIMLKAERDFDKMTNNEERFAQFFNSEITLISAMSEIERIEHIQELEDIAFEAKARLTAAKSHDRDAKAKKRLGGEWTITETKPDQTVTDTINNVELRKKRMTKLDKMQAKLQALGIDPKDIADMMSGLRKVAAKDTQEDRDKAAKAVIAVQKQPAQNGSSPIEPISPVDIQIPERKPLDLSKLKFSK